MPEKAPIKAYLERHGISKPAHEPPYSEENARKTLELFQPQPVRKSFSVSADVTAQFVPADHITHTLNWTATYPDKGQTIELE